MGSHTPRWAPPTNPSCCCSACGSTARLKFPLCLSTQILKTAMNTFCPREKRLTLSVATHSENGTLMRLTEQDSVRLPRGTLMNWTVLASELSTRGTLMKLTELGLDPSIKEILMN